MRGDLYALVSGGSPIDVKNAMRDISSRLQLALQIAAEAGSSTLDFFQRDNLDVERKDDDSPVTQADRGAEQLMREQISKSFPTDGVIGEEFGEEQGTSAYRWVLDPIDGTKSFICGVPLYSVLIGILQDQRSVAGVILIPALGESVYAEEGAGTWWQRGTEPAKRATVANRPLSDGVFLFSQGDSFSERGAPEAYSELERAAYITRSWGDGYGYLLVATGRTDVIVDPIMNLWDAAPMLPVLQEAGGSFTDWQGLPTVLHGEGVGCSQRVREEVLAVTRRFPKLEGAR
jgi:histidinol-phosphatase